MTAAQLPLCALTGSATARRAARLAAGFAGLAIGLVAAAPSRAGDALYGKVIEVKSAEVVVLDYGQGRYDVRIAGIDAPAKGAMTGRSKEFVTRLALGKNAQMRFEGRNKAGEMVGRLLTEEPEQGIKDVGLELIKAGLARRQKNYDYKYRELSAAEAEARKAKRGVWAQPK